MAAKEYDKDYDWNNDPMFGGSGTPPLSKDMRDAKAAMEPFRNLQTPFGASLDRMMHKGTFGLSDYVQALPAYIVSGGKRGISDIREQNKQSAEDYPTSTGIGDIGGGIAQTALATKLLGLGGRAIAAVRGTAPTVAGATAAPGVIPGVAARGTAAAPAVQTAAPGVLKSGQILKSMGAGGAIGGISSGLEEGSNQTIGGEDFSAPKLAGKTALGTGVGVVAGAVPSIVGGILSSGASRLAPISQAVKDRVGQVLNPQILDDMGLVGKATPNLVQGLRMAGGEAEHTIAPQIQQIYDRAGKTSTDKLFPALRENLAAQAPKVAETAYPASFAGRQAAANRVADVAEKAIDPNALEGAVQASGFLPRRFQELRGMVVDAARNAGDAGHGQAAKFIREAINLSDDPAVIAQATRALAGSNTTLARHLAEVANAQKFNAVASALKPGASELPIKAANPESNIAQTAERWLGAAADRIGQGGAQRFATDTIGDRGQVVLDALDRIGRAPWLQQAGKFTLQQAQTPIAALTRQLDLVPKLKRREARPGQPPP